MGPYSGYHDCPCPDCFEDAIGVREVGKGVEPAFCSACAEAGCDGLGDCQADGAYSGYCQECLSWHEGDCVKSTQQ